MRANRTLGERLKAALDGFRGRSAPDAGADRIRFWQLLAETAPDLITRHAPDGRIRFASPAARALLGRAGLEGLTPRDLVHPDDLAAVQAAFRDASYFGRDGAVAARMAHGDGRWLWMELRCRRIPLGEADGGDIVAVTREIAAFKAESAALMAQSAALAEARDAALAATREKSRFLATMSHELRTPLNAILGFSEVMTLQMFGALTPRYREYAGLIRDSGQHLLDLINGLLDMSKIEAGKFELHEELFALEAVTESAVRFVSIAAERAGVSLSADLAPQTRHIFADQRAVKQMLVNLLSNAVKFTPPGGQVTLGAHADGKAVILAVADTGTGIAPADLEKLGQPFEQTQGAFGKEGTGLGLALVKALAALHGGEMHIASVLGEGTSVTLRLPHAAVAADVVVPVRGAA
jgi:cell cycle sensor histidine kinase DivJ